MPGREASYFAEPNSLPKFAACGTIKDMRKIADVWLRQVLALLYKREMVTRAEICETTGLNVASVSLALQHLLRTGTIHKVGELQSNGGRNREVFRLNSEAGFFVTADLEGTRIHFGLTTLVGDIRYRWSEDIEAGEVLDVNRVLAGIDRVLTNLDDKQRNRVIAVGISHPGFTDVENRITAVNLSWSRFDLVGPLQKALGLPCFLEISHNACVMAERWLGVAQGSDDCVFLIVGNGVGIGAYTGGHLLLGARNIAGELGHITIDPQASDHCNCGKSGCLEAIISSPNIVRQYLEKARGKGKALPNRQVTTVFDLARAGDASALEVIDRAGRYLGLALSYLVHLLNPDLIVLGGDLIHGHDLFIPRIRQQLTEHALPRLAETVDVKVSSLGLDIGLKGAASVAFHQSLQDSHLLRERICRPVFSESGEKHKHRTKALPEAKEPSRTKRKAAVVGTGQ